MWVFLHLKVFSCNELILVCDFAARGRETLLSEGQQVCYTPNGMMEGPPYVYTLNTQVESAI